MGGGAIIVPLLVLWIGYEHREATGTSLAAIAIIAAMAAAAHAAYGNVNLGDALLVAAPAIVRHTTTRSTEPMCVDSLPWCTSGKRCRRD